MKIKQIFNNDYFFLVCLSIGFLVLILHDVNSWYYSAIGDEYAFYDYAKDLIEGKVHLSILHQVNSVSIFSQKGVYNIVPVASSLFQALVMKFFGVNHTGWILSSIMIVILTLWFFYFLVRDLFNKTIAIVSFCILISSHYLWAFSHLGYWNIQSIFPPVVSFYFFISGIKNHSWLKFFLAGVGAGLSFYTYFSARAIIVLLILISLFHFKQVIIWKKMILVFILGFLTLFLPYLIVNKEIVFQQMLERSAVGSREIPEGEKLWHFGNNFISSFLAFYHNSYVSHFVSGSLADPITMFFFTLGAILMLFSWKKFYFYFICLGIGLITVGAFSQYTYIPITRLFVLLPIISIVSGFGLVKAIYLLGQTAWYPKKGFGLVLIVFILVSIFLVNYNRFYNQTPQKMSLTKEALIIGALSRYPLCQKDSVIIYPKPEPLLIKALKSYPPSPSVSYVTDFNNWSQLNKISFPTKSCLIASDPEELTSFIIKAKIPTDHLSMYDFYDPSKKDKVIVILKQ